jgi:hypothetical protein
MASRGSRGSRKHHTSSSKSIDLSDLHHHTSSSVVSGEPHLHRGRSREEAAEEAEGAEAGDEADDRDSDVRPVLKPSLPPKPSLVNPPVSFNDNNNKQNSEESETSVILENRIMAMADSNHEGSGTVRRRSRGGQTRSRPQSTGL